MAVIYGINPILELLATDPEAFHHIYIQLGPVRGRLGRVSRLAREGKIPVSFVDRKALHRLSGGQAHQGVVAETAEYRYSSLPDILGNRSSPSRVLVLDGIQDPRNLGAIVRTAVCAGADGMVIPKRGAAAMTETAVKASAGGAAIARIARVTNLAQALETLKKVGFWCVAVEAGGEKVFGELGRMLDYALVFGGEGKGIRRLLRERCDITARIPIRGPIDSLNVSVAVGVTLYALLPPGE